MTDASLPGLIAVFAICAIVIGLVGTRLSALADTLADRTGLGEAFMGAVFLGASTSLPGITASVTAAWDGHPSLAISNAIGGIAAQTAFLAIADLVYPKINLEHAAASVGNMLSGTLLIVLLASLLLAMLSPEVTLFGVHPVTPLLFLAYGFGLRLVFQAHDHPMWRPQLTGDTRLDEPAERQDDEPPVSRLWLGFALSAGVVVVAGWFLTQAAEGLVRQTGISESLVGGLMVAVTTSLPELVTSVAAVRRGALTLAVGGIIGGNAFDTLFAAVADVAYRDGSIYHAVTSRESALVAVTIIMTGVLLLGLLQRERRGIANIGFESALVLGLYVLSVAVLSAF